jgi:hypothetical protein
MVLFFQTESLVLGLAFGLLSRDVIEDIERAKGDSFDTDTSIRNSVLVVLGCGRADQLNVTLLLLKPAVAVAHRKHRNGKVTSVMTSLASIALRSLDSLS